MNKKILVFLLLLITAPVFAADYYVAKNGNDDNDGSEATPYLTIGKAQDMAGPGDTVYIKEGTYTEGFYTPTSGTETARITFRNYQYDNVVLDGPMDLGTWGTGVAYITIQGLTINGTAGAAPYAIYMRGDYIEVLDCIFPQYGIKVSESSSHVPSHHVLIKGNKFTMGEGFRPEILISVGNGSTYVTVENNEFLNNYDADLCRLFGTNHIFRNNIVIGLTNNVIHADLFQLYGSGGISHDILVENNLFQNCPGVAIAMFRNNDPDMNIGNWTFRNNVYDNVGNAMHLEVPYCKIYNNVFINSGLNTAGPILLADYYPDNHGEFNWPHDTTVMGNIFIGGSSTPSGDKHGWYYTGNIIEYPDNNFVGDYNFVAKSKEYNWEPRANFTGTEPHGISGGDPRFVDYDNHDYHLAANSPNIDSSAPMPGFDYDLEGVTRPQGAEWDRGPYEFFQGEHYYIDFINGDDANSGRTKDSAFKYAPGMVAFSGTADLSPGDVIIFKGGVVWDIPLLAVTHWYLSEGITYTSDKTWFDGTEFTLPQIKTDSIIPGDNTAFIVMDSTDDVIIDGLSFGPFGSIETTDDRNGGKALIVRGCDNFIFRNNVLNPYSHHGIVYQSGEAATNHKIYGNTLMNVTNSIEGEYGSGITGFEIHDNTFGPMHDKIANDHADGIQFWRHTGDENSVFQCRIYNNCFTGNWGANDATDSSIALNAVIFLEEGDVSTANLLIYNNIFDMTFDDSTNEPDTIDASSLLFVSDGTKVLNNTFILQEGKSYDSIIRVAWCNEIEIKNNIFFAAGNKIYWQNYVFTTIADINNNVVFNYGTFVANWESNNRDLAWWQSNGYDVDGQTGMPLLDSTYHPVVGSNVLDNGQTLSAYFNTDKDGNTRTPPWDIGAYEASGLAPPPTVTPMAVYTYGGTMVNYNGKLIGEPR